MKTSNSCKDEEEVDIIPASNFNRWIVLLCSTLAYGLAIGTPVSFSVMFLDWQDSFQVTRARTAVVHSTCVGILFGGAIIPGYVMNRYGPRFTLLLGSLLATAGLIVSMFATSIDYLVLSTGVITGLGYSFIQLPIIPCLTLVFKSHQTQVISLCQLVAGLVNIINPHLLRILIKHYSWRGTFAIVAGVTLNICILGLIVSSFHKKKCQVGSITVRQPSNVHEMYDDDDDNDSDDDKVKEHDAMTHQTSPKEEGRTLNFTFHTDGKSYLNSKNKEDDNDRDDDEIKEYDALTHQTSPEEEDRKCNFIFHTDGKTYPGIDYSKNDHQILIKGDRSIIDESKRTSEHCSGNTSRNNRNNSIWWRIKKSKWRFLTDSIYLLFLIHMCFCASAIFSFALILMDFADGKGFGQSTGVFFIVVVFAASMLSRLGVGMTGLFPRVQSLVVQIVISIPGTVAVLLLDFATSREHIVCLLCMVGVTIGGLVSISPRCVLDMRTVDTHTYPIALGFTCSWEGIMNFTIPILIGYSVDVTGSYTLILNLIGCVSMVCTLILAAGVLCRHRQSTTRNRSKLTESQATDSL